MKKKIDNDLLREKQILKSYRKLRCKKCGCEKFYELENYAYYKKNDIFATIQCCSKCGLIMWSQNMAGRSPSADYQGGKPMKIQYIKLANLKTPL